MLRTILLAFVLAALAPMPRADAATFTVNATTDAVDLAPGDGICDSAAGPAVVCTLRAAVQEANALAGSDLIVLGAGTHSLTIAGIDENAAAGDLDVIGAIAIAGQGMTVTTIDQTTTDRVFDVYSPSGRLQLADLTVSGGDCADNASRLGGAIRNLDELVMERVALTGNRAQIGGALFNFGTASASDVEIVGNEATNRAGGISSASFSASGSETTTLTLTRATIGPNTTLTFPSELELANAANAALTNVTVSPASTAMESVTIGNQDVQLVHVTVLGGVSFYSFDGSHQVDFANSAIDYCIPTSPEFMPTLVRSGVNASSDASCGFAAAGGIEGAFGLGPLADNGGPTPTHLPLAGSPLLDAAAAPQCEAIDQRGVSRPRGPGCDVGAVEVPEPGALAAASAALAALLLQVRRRARRYAR